MTDVPQSTLPPPAAGDARAEVGSEPAFDAGFRAAMRLYGCEHRCAHLMASSDYPVLRSAGLLNAALAQGQTGSTVEFYELRKVKYDPREQFIVTAATIDCSLCGRNIDGMGGPGDGPICVPCGKALKRGQLRGAVKWTEEA